MAGNIQFKSALLDDTNDIITIDDVKMESRHNHKYLCPNCRQEMITVMGEYRQHHFRHLGTVCDRDSFLHSLAEQAFYNEFAHCLAQNKPFYLKYYEPIQCNKACVLKDHVNCKEHYISKVVDLTKAYPVIYKESRVDLDGHFRRPDILLSSVDGHQLWIEIWVSHKTDEEKLKDSSILEIKIRNENDVNTFKKHTLAQSLDDVREIGIYGLEYDYLAEYIIESSPLKKLPCESSLMYSFGSYSITLRLNWEGAHNTPKTKSWSTTTEDILKVYCHQRYVALENHWEITEESPFDCLIIAESTHSVKTLQGPHNINPAPRRPHIISRESTKPKVELQSTTPAFSIDTSKIEWVDLGLPSKTLWAKDDLPRSFSFNEAKSICRFMLPSDRKLRELDDSCEKRWEGDNLLLIGPNGNVLSFNCEANHKSYWLNSYAGEREFAQCFHIQRGILTILDNDADAYRLLFVRLMKLFNQ